MKEHEDRLLAQLLARSAVEALLKENWSFELVIPIPIAEKRLREKRFNHAEVLAGAFSGIVKVPLSINSLFRDEVPERKSMIGIERMGASSGFFTRGRLNGKKILLIDDVFVTGTTMASAAKILKARGAETVCGFTLARSLYRQRL